MVLLHQKSEGGALILRHGHFRSFLTMSRQMGAKTPALAQILPIFSSQVGFRSSLIHKSEKRRGAKFGLEQASMVTCAPFARQKWCELGSQASTVFGPHLSMRTCPAYFPGMSCQFWWPRGGCARPWGSVKAPAVMKLQKPSPFHSQPATL